MECIGIHGSVGTHGIHGCPWNPWALNNSIGTHGFMGSHGIYEYPWNPRVPMESTGAHGIHEKQGGGRDMGSVVARGLGGSGRVCEFRKGKREEVGWDGVKQLGGVRAGGGGMVERIQKFALGGSSSSLHSEACNALGAYDGIIHSRISLEVICFRSITNYQNIYRDHLAQYSSKTALSRAHREGMIPCEVY
jgi:hypothetical protein